VGQTGIIREVVGKLLQPTLNGLLLCRFSCSSAWQLKPIRKAMYKIDFLFTFFPSAGTDAD